MDSAVRRAHCAMRQTPHRHRNRTGRNWWTADRQPWTTLQTPARKSISQRRYPQQLHQTTRTHFSHIQVLVRSWNHCNTLQKLLLLSRLPTHLQTGISMYLLMKQIRSYEALYIFSSWNYWHYYNYLQRATRRRGLRGKKEGFLWGKKEIIQQIPRWKDRDSKSIGLHRWVLESSPFLKNKNHGGKNNSRFYRKDVKSRRKFKVLENKNVNPCLWTNVHIYVRKGNRSCTRAPQDI